MDKVHIKGMISRNPDLHLPLHREVLNSLTGNVWFSSTDNNLLTFHCLVLVAKTSIYPGSSLTSLVQSHRAI